MIRLVAVDVDGTLLDSRQRVSERNTRALRAAAGQALIALATGRRYRFALPIADTLEIDCYVIASNGALVRRREGEVRHRHYLPKQRAEEVMATLAAYEAQLVVTFERAGPGELVMKALPGGDSGGAVDGPRRAFAGWLERNREALSFEPRLAACLTEDPVQLMYGGTPAEIAAMGAVLAAQPVFAHVTCMRTIYPARELGILDILDQGVSKGAALAKLAAELGIAPAQVLAIGDNYNDLEMLEFAGTAAVMGNAHEEMRRPGWMLVADHDHDGVAEALARAGLAP